jgi:hypothetical protein
MKNLGYYTMCNKEDMKKNPNLFNPERKDFKEFTKEDESKVLTRVGDSSDFDGIF